MRATGTGSRPAATMLGVMLLVAASASPAFEKTGVGTSKSVRAGAVRKPSFAANPSAESLNAGRDLPGAAKANAVPGVDPPPVESPTTDEKLLVDLINLERTTRRLKPVVWDGVLTRLARLHGDDMRTVRKASHFSAKDGADYGMRLARTSYCSRAAAENVAYNRNVVKAHRALMASPGHRHNILDPGLAAVGTAVLTENSGDWVYVVEDFATSMARVSDSEAAREMRGTLAGTRGLWRLWSLPEDKALSKRLGTMLESMIQSGSLRQPAGLGAGQGWALAFTSMDPSVPPASALAHAAKAESCALAVSFRKTPRYPLGTYWAILFLKGED